MRLGSADGDFQADRSRAPGADRHMKFKRGDRVRSNRTGQCDGEIGEVVGMSEHHALPNAYVSVCFPSGVIMCFDYELDHLSAIDQLSEVLDEDR